jgi:hypothetical protein
MLYRIHLVWVGFELTLVVIGTDCIGSFKIQLPYDHTMMALCQNKYKYSN